MAKVKLFFITTLSLECLFIFLFLGSFSDESILSPLPTRIINTPTAVGAENERIPRASARGTFNENIKQVEAVSNPILGLSDENISIERIESKSLTNKISNQEISAKSAFVIDLTSGKVLFEKDSQRRRPIASTTKILTAMIALEKGNLNQQITVSFQAKEIGESSMGLAIGEKLSLNELLYGLILPSGNDAAESIAEGVGTRREVFIAWMNEKVKNLSLNNSHFTNPSGLDDEKGGQYSSAFDLAMITKEALKNNNFRKIIQTKEMHIPQNETHKSYFLENRLSFDQTYPGIIGVKPGFTDEAGLCLVSLAKKGDHEILAVFLNSDSLPNDSRKIFETFL